MTTQRLYSFLVVFLLMFLGTGFGQTGLYRFTVPKASDTTRYSKFALSEIGKLPVKNPISGETVPSLKIFSIKMVPSSFYTTHLGFVCKKELQLDKLTPIPFRFRLGSLAYVNYLEQKPNAKNPQQ